MLRRAEPSEAYPTTLLTSFEGLPPLAFIHGLKVRGFLRRRVKETMGGFKKGYSFSLTISTKLFIKIGGLIKRVGSSNPSVGSIKQSKG
jgi:hypothetical protein